MNSVLLETGVGCVIAAAIGGGLKAFGIEIPILQSVKRQVLLGMFGAVLVGGSFLVSSSETGGRSSSPLSSNPSSSSSETPSSEHRPDTESAALNGVEGT